MSKEISLKDFYTNPEGEEEDEDSEQDSDFVPDDNESDAEDDVDLEAEEEADEEKEKVKEEDSKKRSLPEDTTSENVNTKKSRIDAIWADMNETKTKPEVTKQDHTPATPTQQEKEEEKPVIKKKKSILNKRPTSSLSSLVSQYNIKEPKLNTLEKSKLDWQGYVDREGIRDDLKYKNKDGYMEKVAFLQRVDDRRLNQLKSGQQKKKE